MSTFEELGLSEKALAAVSALGYDAPTPVQEQAIPLVLEGRDVIAAAKTGTGKTAAFSLPLLDKLGHAGFGRGPLSLVVTPTRELAMQIDEVCRTIARQTKHRVVCLVGGVSYEPQIQKLEKGCDLLISTPGRLLDLIGQGNAYIGEVEALVLDEADRMLDMGFLPDVKRIVAHCPEQRQTMLFSATVDASIEKNMAHLLKDPAYVEVDHRGETADLVEQYRIDVDHRSKQNLLHALLSEKGSRRVIVFARTRYRVDACVRKLRRVGFSALPIHSDRSQNQRKRAIEAFAAGDADILVATDVLARGIDIEKVSYVVNFDLPTQPEDYVHRIGRTGRAGESGFAVSFVTPDDKQVMRQIEKLIGREVPCLQLDWDGSEQSEEAIAARMNRAAARKDPEIAEAVREEKSRKRRAGKGKGAPSGKGRQRAGKRQESRKGATEVPAEASAPRARREGGNPEPSPKQKRQKQAKRQPQKTRGTAAKENKRNRRGAASGAAARGKGAQGKRSSAADGGFKGDFRPGRSQRRDIRNHR